MNPEIRVLHVDDSPDVLDLTATFLERVLDRIEVTSAPSAAAGLERLDDAAFDCVVSDYRMPERDGLDFLRAVRERDADVPFVLFTGEGSETVASEAISAGVSDYMQKETGTDQYEVLANRIELLVTRHRTARELDATNRRFRTLVEESTDAILILDADGTISSLVGPTEDLFGVPDESLVDASSFDLVHTDDRPAIREVFEALATDPGGRETVEFRFRHGSGEWRWAEARGRNLLDDADVNGVVVYARDVTQRHRREARREEFTDRLEGMMLGADVSWWEYDVETAELRFNEAMAAGLGHDRDRLATVEVFLDLLHPDDLEHATRAMTAHLRGETERYETEYRIRTADGDYRWLHDVGGITARDDTGAPLAVSGVSLDVTARKRGERDLQAERDRFRAVFEKAFDAMVIADDEGRYVEVNESACDLFGAPRAELLGTSIRDYAVPEFEVDAAWTEFRAAGDDRGQFPLRRPDGTVRVTEYAATRDVVPGRHLSILRDVTLQVEYAERLERQNDRLAAFGSVVSHDIRSPLSVLAGSLDLLAETGEGDHLDRCHRAIDRIEHLVDDLLILARDGETVGGTDQVAVAPLVRDAWDLVGGDATLAIALDDEWAVDANRARLRQLLENLLRNAREADGTATVTVGTLDGDAGFYVADDGPGLPAAERERVFELGYSTKPGGTGLGLQIVREIAAAHGWSVAATASERGGARFELRDVDVARV